MSNRPLQEASASPDSRLRRNNFDLLRFVFSFVVVHFPVLQLLIAYGYFRASPWLALLSATILIMAAAILLWYLIEKPFLRRTSHYVATNPG